MDCEILDQELGDVDELFEVLGLYLDKILSLGKPLCVQKVSILVDGDGLGSMTLFDFMFLKNFGMWADDERAEKCVVF